MKVFIIAAVLSFWGLSATSSGGEEQKWGVWQPSRPLPFINEATMNAERQIQNGVVSRNLLLAENMRTDSPKRIYINNLLYPIKSVSDQYVQLADIFVEKGLLTTEELKILKQANYGGSAVDLMLQWNTLKKLVKGVMSYLQFIQADEGARNIIQEIHNKLSNYRKLHES